MKPTHNPDIDVAPSYTIGDCVWVWDRFYEEWVAGVVTDVVQHSVFVCNKNKRPIGWIARNAYLQPRTETETIDKTKASEWIGV